MLRKLILCALHDATSCSSSYTITKRHAFSHYFLHYLFFLPLIHFIDSAHRALKSKLLPHWETFVRENIPFRRDRQMAKDTLCKRYIYFPNTSPPNLEIAIYCICNLCGGKGQTLFVDASYHLFNAIFYYLKIKSYNTKLYINITIN